MNVLIFGCCEGCSFALEGDNVTVSGLYMEAASETAREAAYKIYLHPAEEQEQTLVHLLQARHRLAQLCGYPTYAHRSAALLDFRSILTTVLIMSGFIQSCFMFFRA